MGQDKRRQNASKRPTQCLTTKTSSLVVLLTLLVGFVCVVSATVPDRITGTMFITSEPMVTVAWDAVSEAEGYQVQLVMFDKDPVTIFNQGELSETSIELSRPRSGNFIVRVRSWNWKDGEKQYSENWATSDDAEYATVDGKPGPWWLYWRLPTPQIEVN